MNTAKKTILGYKNKGEIFSSQIRGILKIFLITCFVIFAPIAITYMKTDTLPENQFNPINLMLPLGILLATVISMLFTTYAEHDDNALYIRPLFLPIKRTIHFSDITKIRRELKADKNLWYISVNYRERKFPYFSQASIDELKKLFDLMRRIKKDIVFETGDDSKL